MAGRRGAIDRLRKRRHMMDTVGVEDAFGTVIVVVMVVSVLIAIVSLFTRGKLYDEIGKGSFSLDAPDRPRGPRPGSPAAQREAEAEIRQLVEAKSARRQDRGEAPLDVEAEIAALMRPPAVGRDAELREEVRVLVERRNARRVTRGEPPLEVEAEIDRQLRELGA